MKYIKIFLTFIAISLCLALGSGAGIAADEKSADEVAKELANPARSLASLNFNFQYTEFTGDLPRSNDQESGALTFQPTLQFQVQKYVVTPDTFGPDWLVKITVTPVIKNPFVF